MSEQTQNTQEFLDNFNWDRYENGIDAVDASNLKEFEDLVEKTFISTSDEEVVEGVVVRITDRDRSEETRLNSSHVRISYAVFCLKKKKKRQSRRRRRRCSSSRGSTQAPPPTTAGTSIITGAGSCSRRSSGSRCSRPPRHTLLTKVT